MTAIQWTDETWNPVTGCSRVSEGCRHCYIERTPPFRMAGRKLGDPVQLHPDRLDQPFRWKKPRRVFVNSLSDLFHESVPDDFLNKVFDVMEGCGSDWNERDGVWTNKPWHIFQVLTKRPARMLAYITERLVRKQSYADQFKQCPTPEMRDSPAARWARQAADPSFYDNIWLGVSVEDQKTADERIPILLQTPAAVRFVSAEPLLGPVDLEQVPLPDPYLKMNGITGVLQPLSEKDAEPDDYKYHQRHRMKLDWVIVGGESGPQARPCDVAWIRSIVQQCKAAAVPCFTKQLGSSNRCPHDSKGGCWECMPNDLKVREYPHAA